ncbi:hypothetical protein [Nostoc sp. TCL26-01]|nr:hypothetical protein [Nostoc sp. TCL26-01]
MSAYLLTRPYNLWTRQVYFIGMKIAIPFLLLSNQTELITQVISCNL